MGKLIIPENYRSCLSSYETQEAIGMIKILMQKKLCMALKLKRVTAPLFVDPASGLNDDLNGVERPVSFDIPDAHMEAQVVHSLAKWKRMALYNYDFPVGKGLLCDMNAIRRDEELDNLHSAYVDQWDWEKVITEEDRNFDYLMTTVNRIVESICNTLDEVKYQYEYLHTELCREVSFITSQELEDMYPDKTEAGEPVNILQVQQGAGYNSPFDRRQVGYEPFETDGKIKTVERIAPIDDQNATSSMRDVTAATLQKYGEGDIDGIWCCYDAYAQGVYQALREADSDIPMVSVDICNEDIQFMQEGKNWKACATTNWTSNGEAASCYYADPGAWMEIPSVIVTQEMVTSKDGINIENLAEVAGEDYSDTSWMPTCDWMVEALGH